MKSLLNDIEQLDYMIRQLYKMSSKMQAGHWIDAWRDNGRLIATLEKNKSQLLEMGVGGESNRSEAEDNPNKETV